MSDFTTCSRCRGSLGSDRVTRRGDVCPHCAAPLDDVFGKLAPPDLDADVTSDPVAVPNLRRIARRLRGPAGRVIAGLLAFGAVLVGFPAFAPALSAVPGSAALMPVCCIAFVTYPVVGLLAFVWYLEKWATVRQWVDDQATTTYVFLMLLVVIVGFPVGFAAYVYFFG